MILYEKKDFQLQLQRQLQLLLQRQLQLQLLLELLLGATDHVLFFKKDADLCQNKGNLKVGWVAAGSWFQPI